MNSDVYSRRDSDVDAGMKNGRPVESLRLAGLDSTGRDERRSDGKTSPEPGEHTPSGSNVQHGDRKFCPTCERRWFDLGRQPPTCPFCGGDLGGYVDPLGYADRDADEDP